MDSLYTLRERIRSLHTVDEPQRIHELVKQLGLSQGQRTAIKNKSIELVNAIRADDEPGLMEVFLAEYGLSTDEGVALMCLAEALLRVPDADTIDELIEDKIAPSRWGAHLGKSSSSLVNASTWALMLTGKVLDDDSQVGISSILHTAIKRLGEPVIRTAVKRAMKELGSQFVLGESIEEAHDRGTSSEAKGYRYSYDMLGEAALTEHDAQDFFAAYLNAIHFLKSQSDPNAPCSVNPGISIKLSALHPRYEYRQCERVLRELVPRTLELALLAKSANMGLNIDAEEADRLDLSLDVIQNVLVDKRLAGWDGFGVVVQAYSKRAPAVIEWLYQLADQLDRKLMVRLVKGAYWDSEIKLAQVEGLVNYPVYTKKAHTDISYMACAHQLLKLTDRLYPQFATHNAHSVATVLELATDSESYEFQRLHGMGEALHRLVMNSEQTRCRIYAPVGEHEDLLAYLVRRLLENGANSSFVNQVIDNEIPAERIAEDPLALWHSNKASYQPPLPLPNGLYLPERYNSTGINLQDKKSIEHMNLARSKYKHHQWQSLVEPSEKSDQQNIIRISNPANPEDIVGTIVHATIDGVDHALSHIQPWQMQSAKERADVLIRASELYESQQAQIFALLAREAGKTPMDAVAELREAVDFLRYYAAQATGTDTLNPVGVFACISPWNFPLAIFTGQIAAALAAGNGVIAKPAEPTPLIAQFAVSLLHEAGVPSSTLKLLPGEGGIIGAQLVSDPRIHGVCFTGSTHTAKLIHRSMAHHLNPSSVLIAETGGLNAMVVDSTALPEQAVTDILASAFQSAGQRCSACRILYVQVDIADRLLRMLFGAMDELNVGDPWNHQTDVGPIISHQAKAEIDSYIEQAESEGRVLKRLSISNEGNFVGPAVIQVAGIHEMTKEVFGPVLHVATFQAQKIDQVIEQINASGYGLTFGLHTRIDDRVETLTSQLHVGNMYINRNQIGAVVGSQPFGGEGLSGTGPKAGGPDYLPRFCAANQSTLSSGGNSEGVDVDIALLRQHLEALNPMEQLPINTTVLPGPTGESNTLIQYPSGVILCLGPGIDTARQQAAIAKEIGCTPTVICQDGNNESEWNGVLKAEDIKTLRNIAAVCYWADDNRARDIRIALAEVDGAIIPMSCSTADMNFVCTRERHVCVDTTASGGNATLLAGSE
ncbi:MAG: bifunctional proline dehydrogenase/L-glutamate gamma-semialdehyde dehydrogenase PutA [Gammaproteobacteria bacterium]|nr:bifunctional proline dehydrogenase/L-glutamate gamma-semialdehyde dehydrogenase PutA [Gammaproteobacteria bacterium]